MAGLRILASAIVAVNAARNNQASALPTAYSVDCNGGSDAGQGTPATPWRTINHARDVIRLAPIVATTTVLVAGDCFSADGASPVLTLDTQDSGVSADVQVVYQAVGSARLLGGVPVPASAWQPSSLGAGVLSLDLAKVNVSSSQIGSLGPGQLGQCTNNQMEIFFGDAPMQMARYPNIAANGTWMWMRIAKVTSPSSFIVADTRPLSWHSEPDAWLHGYWSFDWADSYAKVLSVTAQPDGASVEIALDPATPVLYGLLPGARFYGVNLVSELDAPGEFYFNRSAATAQFLPPAPVASAETFLSLVPVIVVAGNPPSSSAASDRNPHAMPPASSGLPVPPSDAAAAAAAGRNAGPAAISFVTLRGFGVHFARSHGLSVLGAFGVTLDGLEASNHGHSAVMLTGAASSLVNSRADGTGCAASYFSGGDVASLTPGGLVVSNCSFARYARVCRTYQAGIGWGGVGNTYTGNVISTAPHVGILGGGNDNTFQFNTLSNLTYEASDSGGWYAGRSWTARGNVITNNTFMYINNTEGYALGAPSVEAVYLDDQLSGTTISGNTFIGCNKGAFVGGGRDTLVSHNTFIGNGYAVHIDNRGMNWQLDSCTYNSSYTGALVQGLFDVKYQQPPYSTRYPELPGLLQYHPCVPVNITVTGNRYCRLQNGFMDVTANETAQWLDSVTNNAEFAC